MYDHSSDIYEKRFHVDGLLAFQSSILKNVVKLNLDLGNLGDPH